MTAYELLSCFVKTNSTTQSIEFTQDYFKDGRLVKRLTVYQSLEKIEITFFADDDGDNELDLYLTPVNFSGPIRITQHNSHNIVVGLFDGENVTI